jgi:RNA polymerase sigma factor (TIGR02999 family)
MHDGEKAALDPFLRLVMAEMRRRARFLLVKERAGHTLQATSLVNEAFLRLFDGSPIPWADSSAFLLSASREMRRVLLDHARRTNSSKRQRGKSDKLTGEYPAPATNLSATLEVDQALSALAQESPRAEKIVELRFFGGLQTEEIAAVLGVSTKTVAREWSWARAWLLRYMTQTTAGAPLSNATRQA